MAELLPASESWSPTVGDFVERLRDLDETAWQEFFSLYHRKMYNFAFVRTGDRELAEDVASEVFAAAVKGIGRFRYTGAPLDAWLYRIARSLTADHLKRRRRRPTVSMDAVEGLEIGGLEEAAWSPQVEDRQDIVTALAKLKREHQEVLVLIFQEGMTTAEAADTLGKKPGAIRVLQHRALAALRREMEIPRGGKRR